MAKRTPLKAIRAKCLECTCNQPAEVRCCDIVTCSLHEYRMGHRPSMDKDIGSDELIEKTEATCRVLTKEV